MYLIFSYTFSYTGLSHMFLAIDQYVLARAEHLACHNIRPLWVVTVADIAYLIVLVWQYFIPSYGAISKVINTLMIVAICLHLYFSLARGGRHHSTSDQGSSPLFQTLRLISLFWLTISGTTLLFDSSPLTISMVAGNLCFFTSMYFSALVGRATKRST